MKYLKLLSGLFLPTLLNMCGLAEIPGKGILVAKVLQDGKPIYAIGSMTDRKPPLSQFLKSAYVVTNLVGAAQWVVARTNLGSATVVIAAPEMFHPAATNVVTLSAEAWGTMFPRRFRGVPKGSAALLLVSACSSVTHGSASMPLPPLDAAQLVGTWIGYDEDSLLFYRLSLASRGRENKLLGLKVKRLGQPGVELDNAVALPPELEAKVIASDPKWHFIVLDAGEDKGVVERGELLVSRHGEVVAKARVSRVQKKLCIANLVNGWELGEILEGDVQFPLSHAHNLCIAPCDALVWPPR